MEAFLLLESIDCKKLFGYDKIHPLLLSSAALEIFRPVTYIINLTLKQGIFPDSLKKLRRLSRFSNKALVLHAVTTDPYQFSVH